MAHERNMPMLYIGERHKRAFLHTRRNTDIEMQTQGGGGGGDRCVNYRVTHGKIPRGLSGQSNIPDKFHTIRV